MNHVSRHAFEAARPGECCNVTLRRRKKDDLSEMPGFLLGGFRSGKCFTCECLSILFGGMAQKLYEITALKGDICKHAK